MLFKIRKAIRSDKFEKCLFIFGLLFMFYGIIRIFINPPIQELIIFIIFFIFFTLKIYAGMVYYFLKGKIMQARAAQPPNE